MPQPLPAKYDFSLYRGDTRIWEHHLTLPDLITPIDITGWVFTAKYRATPNSTDVIAVEACVVTDGPGGIVRRTLTATESAKLPRGSVAWDLQALKPGGEVKTYLTNSAVVVVGDASR